MQSWRDGLVKLGKVFIDLHIHSSQIVSLQIEICLYVEEHGVTLKIPTLVQNVDGALKSGPKLLRIGESGPTAPSSVKNYLGNETKLARRERWRQNWAKNSSEFFRNFLRNAEAVLSPDRKSACFGASVIFLLQYHIGLAYR